MELLNLMVHLFTHQKLDMYNNHIIYNLNIRQAYYNQINLKINLNNKDKFKQAQM